MVSALAAVSRRRGHSSLVTEVHRQLPGPPAAVILSVGGGGLANGVIEGLDRVGKTLRLMDAWRVLGFVIGCVDEMFRRELVIC